MSRIRFADAGAPAQPVSNVAADVRHHEPNTAPVVRQIAEPSEPVPTTKAKVRASQEFVEPIPRRIDGASPRSRKA